MKNFLTTLSFAFVALLTVSNVCLLAEPFGGGNGTVNNPYQIKTRQDMEELADSVDGGNNYENKY